MQQFASISKLESRVHKMNEETNTLFLFNLSRNSSTFDIKELASLYGEVLNMKSFVETKGQCFITFCDLRDSVKFFKDFNKGKSFKGRTVFANYANSSKGNKMSSVIVCPTNPTSMTSNLDESNVSEALSVYGEIRSISLLSNNTYQVIFFNIKHASLALSYSNVAKTRGGVLLSISRDQTKNSDECSPLLTHYQLPKSFACNESPQSLLQRAYHPATIEQTKASLLSPFIDPYSINYQSINFINRLIVAN